MRRRVFARRTGGGWGRGLRVGFLCRARVTRACSESLAIGGGEDDHATESFDVPTVFDEIAREPVE